jgi:hypothetical protein
MEIGFGVMLWELENQRLQENLVDGLKAVVRLHYTEYTDQEEVYAPVLEAMQTILDHVYGVYDLEEIVTQVEREINADGGVKSDSDGSRHRVVTFPEAYAETDE